MRLDQSNGFDSTGMADLFYPSSGDFSSYIPRSAMPAPTTMTMPGMTATAQATSPNPQPDLAPMDLVRPLPTIVNNQPIQIAQCNSFSEWVDKNPLMAAGLLLGLAWALGRNQ